MEKPIVVLVSGWMGSGKDTLVDRLVKQHGFVRFGFADELKDDVSKEMGFDRQRTFFWL